MDKVKDCKHLDPVPGNAETIRGTPTRLFLEIEEARDGSIVYAETNPDTGVTLRCGILPNGFMAYEMASKRIIWR